MTFSYTQRSDRPDSADVLPANPSRASQCWLSRVSTDIKLTKDRSARKRAYPRILQTSHERRGASLTEPLLNVKALSPSDITAAGEKEKTVLYLAYGSNLCNETFREKRGIKPLSQINVLVPSLRLTFDLPGIPYVEPCFGNTAMRDPIVMDYHKDRWHKGLVGCVYEVTPSDYAHIIATEGGGAGYQDILVDCYPLEDGDTVPHVPTTPRFVAHTLFAPSGRSLTRPNSSYAQPSARYLKLITDGAVELALPQEYREYLDDIRTYTITTKRQQLGQLLFVSLWWPLLQLLLALSTHFQDDQGRVPDWLAKLSGLLFAAIWGSYDKAFKKVFGDGERTEGDEVLGLEIYEKRIGNKYGRVRGGEVDLV